MRRTQGHPFFPAALLALCALRLPCWAGNAAVDGLRGVYETSRAGIEARFRDRQRELTADYQRALAAARDQLQKAGDLDGVMAVDAEARRAGAGGELPADAAGEHAAVLKLRGDQRGRLAEAGAARDTQFRELTRRYVERLDWLKAELTRQGRLDEALAAKNESERVGTLVAESADKPPAGGGGAEVASAAGGTRRPCVICQGTGDAFDPCSACNGTGKCPRCGGTGKRLTELSGTPVMCLACKGTGVCRPCDGAGRVKVAGRRCHACGGTGTIEIPPPVAYVRPATGTGGPSVPRPPVPPPAPPHVDPSATARQFKEYVATMASLREQFNAGNARALSLCQVLGDSPPARGTLIRSSAYLVQAHARSVRVAASPGTSSPSVTMIPYALDVGLAAERVGGSVGPRGRVTITYGIVSDDNFTLFDIQP